MIFLHQEHIYEDRPHGWLQVDDVKESVDYYVDEYGCYYNLL